MLGTGPRKVIVPKMDESESFRYVGVWNQSVLTIPFKRPTAIGRDIDDVTNPLTHLDGNFAKLLGHGINSNGRVFVVTEHPCITTLM
jgi:hypothetical protein